MNFEVRITKKARKNLGLVPKDIQEKFAYLLDDLQKSGAMQKPWHNFGKVGEDRYHCHLSYRWIACWYWNKKTIIVEVYYVGSREKAPY